MPESPRFPTSGVARLRPPRAWHGGALCAQIGPDEWYRSNRYGRGPGGLTETEVRQVCQRCPVQRYCLAEALHGVDGAVEAYGIWATTTARQRRRLAAAVAAGHTTIDELADRLRIEDAAAVAAWCKQQVRPTGVQLAGEAAA